MYPVSLGFGEAQKRIRSLLKNNHDAEALVTSVFTFEKLIRRSVRVAILARGFTSKQADTLIGRKGFSELKDLWLVFDRSHRPLPSLLENSIWERIAQAVEMRNKLVHGSRVYKVSECRDVAKVVLKALAQLHSQIKTDFECDPWEKLKGRRNPKLKWH